MQYSMSIQHAHFDAHRRQLCAALVASIPQRDRKPLRAFSVVRDRNRDGLWPTFRRCLMTYGSGATHHIIIQDDVKLCPDFIPAVMKCSSLRPNALISFYSARNALLKARDAGKHWVQADGAYTMAFVTPTSLILPFLRWVDRCLLEEPKWDDATLTVYAREHNIPVLWTAPSLVQHIAPGESVVGNSNPRNRSSQWFIGDESPLDVDWTVGANNPYMEKAKMFGDLPTRGEPISQP